MSNNPPKFFLRFLRWFCHPELIRPIEGDLMELYDERIKEFGKKKADRKFIKDVIQLFRKDIIKPASGTYRLTNYGMIKNYFKVTVRNLFRQKLYSAINIGGLSVGLTSFILIFLYVQHELSYDNFYTNSDEIFRVYQQNEGETYLGTDMQASTPMAVASAMMEEFPEVKKATTVRSQETLISANDNHYYEKGLSADQFFFEVFNYPLVQGNPKSALAKELSIVISESLSRRIFGDENPMGKQLIYRNRDTYNVTGIMKDLPANSSLQVSFITAIISNGQYVHDAKKDGWGNNDYYTFFTMSETFDKAVLESKFPALLDKHPVTRNTQFRRSYLVQPLSSLHLENNFNFDIGIKGNKQYLTIFSIIAVIVLLLACINYMNLAIARSIRRSQEVGIRKVMGAFQRQLIIQFIGESIFIAFIAFIISLTLAAFLVPIFGEWLDRPLALDLVENLTIIPILFLLVVIVGSIAGSYPAFFIAKVEPARALKGKIESKPSKLGLQKWLIILQYSVAIALIIGSITIYQQFHFIQNKELGYKKEHVLIVSIYDRNVMKNIDALKTQWQQNPNIRSITTAAELPTNVTSGTTIRHLGQAKEEAFSVYRSRMSYDFLEVFEIELIAGRDFSDEYASEIEESRIINETAAAALGWTPEEAVGKQFLSHKPKTIIGVVKDFHMHSMHSEIAPMFLMLLPDYFEFIAFKVNPENIKSTIPEIEESIAAYSPYPFEYRFLDDQFDQLYKSDYKLGEMVGTFTCIAIMIASLGLFGLAAFTVGQRIKEIGIRKVLGARVSEIVFLLSQDFLKLVGIGFLIAIPIGWYILDIWLGAFAYRISIPWWIFIAAGLLSVIVSTLTIGSQSIKAALSNPVDSLKNE